MKQAVLVAAYLAAIILANLSVARWGASATVANAFLLIGLDLTTRDRLDDLWRRHRLTKMAGLIALGSSLSWLVNPATARIAVASAIAFALSATADAVAYHFLRRKPWLERSNGSNVLSAAVDSVAFPTLAFGVFLWPIVLGQFTAKVAGGMLWSWVLGRRRIAVEHRLPVRAICPVDGSADLYDAIVRVDRILEVEEIRAAVAAATRAPIYQEELAQKLARTLGASIELVGRHSGVGTLVVA